MSETSNDGMAAVWDPEKEDPEIAGHGTLFAWGQGRSPAVQTFVEALSRKIGYKVDWAYTGGRAHLDVMPEGREAALEALKDEAFVKPFLKLYASENWKNGTYFRIDLPEYCARMSDKDQV